MSEQTKKHLIDVAKAAVAAAITAFVMSMIRGLGLDHIVSPTAAASALAGFFALKFRS